MSCKILAEILEYELYEMHAQRHVNIGTIYENMIVVKNWHSQNLAKYLKNANQVYGKSLQPEMF